MRLNRILLTFSVAWVIASVTVANADATNEFDSAVKKYQTLKSNSDKKMLKAFDRVIAQIRTNRNLSAETRNRHILEIQDEKQRFVKSNELPYSDGMLLPTLAYVNELYGKSTRLNVMFESALERAIGDRKEFDRIESIKDRVQSILPGRTEIGGNTQWNGSRALANGRVVDFYVRITRYQNNSFEGEIWQDVTTGGKTGWAFEGKLEGNAIELVTKKILYGKAGQMDLRGFVIGNRIILMTFANGMQTNEVVSVNKK